MGNFRSTPTSAAYGSAFRLLRRLQELEKHALDFLGTLEDRALLCEIGHRQAEGRPLLMKEAFLLGVGSVATVQRQLRRLRAAGLISQVRAPDDRRVACLQLTPKAQRAFAYYARMLSAEFRRI